jgi:hypothetical protein
MTSSASDILRKVAQLPKARLSGGSVELESVSFPNVEGCYIARDKEGNVMCLIRIDSEDGINLPSIRTEYLLIEPNLECVISNSGRKKREWVFSVSIHSVDMHLVELFIRVFGALIARLPSRRTRVKVQGELSQLIELFRSLEKPARKSINGLWGELFIMATAPDTEYMVNHWHSSPYDKFDFVAGGDALEVKTTFADARVHHFSIEQLHPSQPLEKIYIASVITEESRGGMSIVDLSDSIREKLVRQESHLKFENIFYRALGSSWKNSNEIRFDYDRAVRTLKFYDADEVPKLGKELPAGVSGVSFKSSLELVNPLDVSMPGNFLGNVRVKR